MKAIFLPGTSPINNKSSTFLYRLLLKAWFETRLYRCKQIIVGKEACSVSCLWGLWNTCFDNGASVVKPAWQRLALWCIPSFPSPPCILAFQPCCSSPPILLYLTKMHGRIFFFRKFWGRGCWDQLVSVTRKQWYLCITHLKSDLWMKISFSTSACCRVFIVVRMVW